MPPNLTQINEIYLQDDDYVSVERKLKLTKRQREAFRSFVMGNDVDWQTIFEFFGRNEIPANDLLMGPDILDIITEYYYANYARLPYTDFLWTYRSMMLPICLLLKNELPVADVYHSTCAGYSGVLAAMAKCLRNKPALLTEHGIYTREREEDIIRTEDFNGLYKDIWIEHFYKLAGCAYKYCDKVISLFEGARSLQVELGCGESKTMVVPNGVVPDRFDKAPGKINNNEINLGILARVSPIKDIKTLINSYASAHESVPNLHLYIMGGADDDNPEYNEECIELTKTLDLKQVHFTGNIDVMEYIGKMDMIILTSISEGQPIAILEGMSARKPCITTKVGCCEELLLGKDPESDAPCGIITPIMSVTNIANAIVELALNEQKRRLYGAVGRERIERSYQRNDLIENYRNIYTNIVKEYKPI